MLRNDLRGEPGLEKLPRLVVLEKKRGYTRQCESAEETSSHTGRFLINVMPAHHHRVGCWPDKEIIAAGVVQCHRTSRERSNPA